MLSQSLLSNSTNIRPQWTSRNLNEGFSANSITPYTSSLIEGLTGTNYTNLYNLVNSSKNDVIDNSGNLVGSNDNPSTNIKDVLLHDLNDSLVQQNLLYITGTITAATLIIAAIVISRK